MAYIKVFAIRQRLDKTTAYATNEQKTTETIMMEDGQERQVRYVGTVQCANVEEAYQEMQETKRQWRTPKTGYKGITSSNLSSRGR